VKAVVFDLGNVLVEWDPRLLLSAAFITDTDFFAWNAELDQGAPFADVVARVRAEYPHYAHECDAFRDRWPELLGPVDEAVVAVVDELRAAGARVFVLSNSSAETLPRSDVVPALLEKFDGVLVSGEVGLVKPDAAIYALAVERFGLVPSATWFVDDSKANVDAAIAAGWNGHHLTDAAALRAYLRAAGLL
jgi:HAD superfamily hydrolase (TIGR01509 family)